VPDGGKRDGTVSGKRFAVPDGGRKPPGKDRAAEGNGAKADFAADDGSTAETEGRPEDVFARAGEAGETDGAAERAFEEGTAGELEDGAEPDGAREDDAERARRSRAAARMFRLVALLVAIALAGQAAAVLPRIYSVDVIRLLTETRELNRDERIRAFKAAIVVVEAEGRKGTGFNVDERGLIVTNRHVVGESREAVIAFEDGRVFRARVAAEDGEADLAVLVPDGTAGASFPALELDAGASWSPGDDVYYIGNPLFFRHLAARGAMLGLTQAGRPFPVLLIEAPVHPGNSGSPVMTGDGRVIGVLYASAELEKDGKRRKAGLAIPADHPFFAGLAGLLPDR